MLSKTGRVVSINTHELWVESRAETGCHSCALKGGCGHSLLAMRRLPLTMPVHMGMLSQERIKPGDTLLIELSERALLGFAAQVYLGPLLALLAAATLVSYWLPEHVLLQVMAAVAGAAIALWLNYRHARQSGSQSHRLPHAVEVIENTHRSEIDTV